MPGLARIPNLGHALRDALIMHKPRVALIEANRHQETARLTFQEVWRESGRLTGLLREHGVAPGDRVAILMTNQWRWPVSAIAVIWSGAVLVPLDYKLPPADQAKLLAFSEARALITESAIARELEPHLTNLSTRPILVVAPDPDLPAGARDWNAEPRSTPDIHLEQQPEDVACIVFSSGAGGDPKGCMMPHRAYLAQAETLAEMFPFGPGDRFFSILPSNHAIDFMSGFLIPLLTGGTVVHQRTLRPEYLAWTLRHYQITHMAAVPLLLEALKRRIEEKTSSRSPLARDLFDMGARINRELTLRTPSHGLSRLLLKPLHDEFGGRLRLIFAGGAFVPEFLARWFYDRGLPVVIGYGLTEAGAVLTVNGLSPWRGDSVGRPIPGVEIRIHAPDSSGPGEVWARGPNLMRGYLNNPELTAETMADGWLRTGDLGWLDASDHLHLVGRRKNLIVTAGGKNVYPEDVESSLAGLPGAEEFCIFADSYIWPAGSMIGEQLVIAIRWSPGADLNHGLTELRSRNRLLADFRRVSHVLNWSQPFPRTASMKIKREALAREIRESLTREEALRPI
ncbi:MAG: 3-[(3aS,4S,7aS)-7a-methyl-1,5-dioxo-octahydro-1H-inden-4-yl]propanoyl:CoA ligase [Myxococcota bacterium]|nr:3-[(3aS,4S,7aS)-7a-methyl-1,5-dioxo-octahydro-1H-inden-4-yl]propanoyl:CoA ligase [Myxococcota bacterium]